MREFVFAFIGLAIGLGNTVVFRRGGETGEFVDTIPNAFSFVDATGADISTVVASDTITITGITAPTDISIVDGQYSINGGAWTVLAGLIENNDTLQVRRTSSGSFLTAVTTTVTIGGVFDAFSITTEAQDITPEPFVFTDVTGANISTVYTSNAITVTGINDAAPITVTGGEYRKNGGSWVSTAGTVVTGDSVDVRGTSSGSYLTAVNVVLTIGGVSDTYTITTEAEPLPSGYVPTYHIYGF
jgi:hypothetical protein